MNDLDIYNRRRANRLNRRLQVSTLDHNYRPGRGVVLNVSATGARLVTQHNLPETFWLQLDEHTEVAATPVWRQPLERSTVVGVRFDFRCERERRRVIRFLQKLAA